MNQIRLTRRELYDLVWSESLLSLSKKYEISDVGLRKVCKRMNIPLPRLGYWQKLRTGRRISLILQKNGLLVRISLKINCQIFLHTLKLKEKD
jgi:hypothetical protein